MQPPFSVLVGGVLPFFAVYIEMSFIMSSLWMDKFYYMFPFLLLVMTVLVITCAEVTIVMCYFQLCSEVRSSLKLLIYVNIVLRIHHRSWKAPERTGFRPPG